MQLNKFLIIRFSSLGDVVIATSLVETLKINFPNSKIYFLTKDIFNDVFINNPNIEKVFCLRSKNMFSLIKEINKENIDVVFDIHGSLRSYMFSLFIKGKVIKYNKNSFRRRLLVLLKIFSGKIITTKEKYLACVKKIKKNATYSNPKIYLSMEEKANVKRIIDCIDSEACIGINTGARWKAKRWILENYVELINKLASNNFKILIFGDNSDLEFNENIFYNINEKYKDKVLNLTDSLNLRTLFSVISFCKVMFTTDSAVLHISQSLNVPVVSVFGPTVVNFGFWDPKDKDILLEKQLECRPCSLHGGNVCPKGHFKCMKGITVEEVKKAIEKLIN